MVLYSVFVRILSVLSMLQNLSFGWLGLRWAEMSLFWSDVKTSKRLKGQNRDLYVTEAVVTLKCVWNMEEKKESKVKTSTHILFNTLVQQLDGMVFLSTQPCWTRKRSRYGELRPEQKIKFNFKVQVQFISFVKTFRPNVFYWIWQAEPATEARTETCVCLDCKPRNKTDYVVTRQYKTQVWFLHWLQILVVGCVLSQDRARKLLLYDYYMSCALKILN